MITTALVVYYHLDDLFEYFPTGEPKLKPAPLLWAKACSGKACPQVRIP